ncbi:MAG: peptidylprolyl isomerase [Planctomycetia bacterium]|nr:peptidylprolyl isomerase [Planctomycetia bacterium]
MQGSSQSGERGGMRSGEQPIGRPLARWPGPWWRRPWVREATVAAAVVVAALGWRFAANGTREAVAKPPRDPAAAPVAPPADELVAMVNGAEIRRGQLAAECLARHGRSVLDSLVNKRIISQACRQRGIVVTDKDVDAEIDAMTKRFNVPRDKWIEMIGQERGIVPRQYAEEIVWPMLALRRLAQGTADPSEEEIADLFDNQFGPAVKARIIVTRSGGEAEALRKQALAAPDEFGALARQYSIDVGSASANGWVQPVRRHTGEPAFEAVVFGLAEGQISPVVQVADQFIVVKCEGHLPAAEVKLADVRKQLAAEIAERKSRETATTLFRSLREGARVTDGLADPRAAAGAAAVVNDEVVSLDELRSACIDRHGADVLEILVSRTLIKQALDRERISITQADVDAEVARAAEALGFRGADGRPDVQGWLERVTREERVPMQHYIEDVVQPTVALKKLVGTVPVTREDLDKAFQATFGPRARCRMIVLDSQRRAQEVWQLARQQPTAERIGDLAERYSVDPTTRGLRGEVPPLQRYGGQPALEREAFALQAGELSGVIQIADRFLVLFCEGYTEPAPVRFEEVRDELYDDILEKKQRIEMARAFSHLREAAAIDNHLAGTSQSPVRAPAGPVAGVGLPEVPGVLPAEPNAARMGSRRGAAATDSGVVPASLEAPGGGR